MNQNGLLLSQLALVTALVSVGAIKASEIATSMQHTIDLLEKSLPENKKDNITAIKTLKEAIEILSRDEESDIFASAWFADIIGNA